MTLYAEEVVRALAKHPVLARDVYLLLGKSVVQVEGWALRKKGTVWSRQYVGPGNRKAVHVTQSYSGSWRTDLLGPGADDTVVSLDNDIDLWSALVDADTFLEEEGYLVMSPARAFRKGDKVTRLRSTSEAVGTVLALPVRGDAIPPRANVRHGSPRRFWMEVDLGKAESENIDPFDWEIVE